MAPLPSQEISQLVKRYYSSYGYNRGSTYRPWWVVFCVVIPILIILFLCCGFRRRNFKRKAQGMQPVPYTGWTTYQWNGNNNNQQQQQQQQPYYKPEGDHYDYNQQPGNNQYNQYNQPPDYYQTTGGNNSGSGVNDVEYQRPEGPPPGHTGNTSGPTYPQNAYTK